MIIFITILIISLNREHFLAKHTHSVQVYCSKNLQTCFQTRPVHVILYSYQLPLGETLICYPSVIRRPNLLVYLHKETKIPENDL